MPPRNQFRELDPDIEKFLLETGLSDEHKKHLKTLLFKVQMQGSRDISELIYEGIGSWCRHNHIENDCVGSHIGVPIHQQIQMLLNKLLYDNEKETQ